jgi:hypothetical protein
MGRADEGLLAYCENWIGDFQARSYPPAIFRFLVDAAVAGNCGSLARGHIAAVGVAGKAALDFITA